MSVSPACTLSACYITRAVSQCKHSRVWVSSRCVGDCSEATLGVSVSPSTPLRPSSLRSSWQRSHLRRLRSGWIISRRSSSRCGVWSGEGGSQQMCATGVGRVGAWAASPAACLQPGALIAV
eukprot:364888-Chlamydomonas_euryale.AAC.10